MSDTRKQLRRFQFTVRGRRRTLRLGRVTKSNEAIIRSHVMELCNRVAFGLPISSSTAKWLGTVGVKLRESLSRHGLLDGISIRAESNSSLKAAWDAYVSRRRDIKPTTRGKLELIGRSLVSFLGLEKEMRLVSVADAKDWRASLVASKLSPPTISGYVIRARQVFNDAVDRGLTASNPFREIKAGSQANQSRERFIDRRMMGAVFEACPDAEWRLIFALARYGGFRTPSETNSLKWTDIDIHAGRIRVPSPKTAHIAGKECRTIPLFPELKQFIEEQRDAVGHLSEFVIVKHRGENLRTYAHRIIRNAGLNPWPRTFQNLRSSRETELTRDYALHVVCRWIGNSPAIARKHYLQVTEEDFNRATGASAAKSASSPRENNGGSDNDIPDFSVEFDYSSHQVAATGLDNPPKTRLSGAQFKKALHKARHALVNAADQMARDDLDRLESEIRSARGRA